MVEFSPKQQSDLKALFDKLNDAPLRYVILRGYQSLPESVPGVDIDIFVDPTQFDDAVELVKRTGFHPEESRGSYLASLAGKAVNNPLRAMQVAVTEPRKMARLIRTSNLSDESLRGQFDEFKSEKDGVHVHLQNHLAYVSPRNQKKVRVSPNVEKQMLDHRRKYSSFYVPDSVDELLHLICRGVFDYEGDFPDYYVDRCEELWQNINTDSPQEERFERLLSAVFYQGDQVVHSCIRSREFTDIRERLKEFSDY